VEVPSLCALPSSRGCIKYAFVFNEKEREREEREASQYDNAMPSERE